MNTPSQPVVGIDAWLPPEMAQRAEAVGRAKAAGGFWSTLILAMMAGAFIALGAIFATTVTSGASGELPFGVVKLLGGVVFCLGLILVVVAGAELFTGNNLIVMAWASRSISTGRLLRNWLIVYIGNFIGSLAMVVFSFFSDQYTSGQGAVGLNALNIALAKVQLGFVQAVMLGILCNALVCLAVWLTFSARSLTDKILSILFPITAFVAAGYEHSIANMYFVPMGIVIREFAPASFWEMIGRSPVDYQALTWPAFLLDNLLPVTIGNIVGGSVLVGAIYWFLYLRPRTGSDPVSEQ